MSIGIQQKWIRTPWPSSFPVMTIITGTTAPGFEAVRDAFEQNFADTVDVGASVAAYVSGKEVVNLQGGFFDEARTAPYDANTLQLVFSTTKGATALCVAILADRGLVDYSAPVARYWPEFAQSGKADITVEQLMSHQAGLFTVDNPPSFDAVLRWGPIVDALASQTPYWAPGTTHGYHALTYGWLAGELVRKVDGRSIGRFFADEIAGPLGLDFWIGLPENLEQRVSPLIAAEPLEDDAKAMIDAFMGPASNLGRALSLSGAIAFDEAHNVFNSRAVHAAEIPAANGITNARSLARMYAGALGHIDGVTLFSEATRDRIRTRLTTGSDQCIIMETAFGCGFMTHCDFTPYGGPGSFGHTGAGGSVAFAHPESGVSFGYAMNKMDNALVGDVRTTRLIDALYSCL